MIRPRLVVAFFIGCATVAGGIFAWQYGSDWFGDKLVDETSSSGAYDHRISLALDGFAGYSVLRSKPFHDQLRAEGVRVDLVDDGADYRARIDALRKGEIQMATFTVDALIRVSDGDEVPASVVSVIDESRGADALVAYIQAVPNLRALTESDAPIVATPDSPSEYLVRVVMSHFQGRGGTNQRLIERDGSADVLAALRGTPKTEPRAFALWEPEVSQALEDRSVHVLVDTSALRGHVIDVLVAERKFLRSHPEVVDAVLRSYFTALYQLRADRNQLLRLVMTGTPDAPLGHDQAERVLRGIHFAGLRDNYAYLGLEPLSGVVPLEDAVRDISLVLERTDGVQDNKLRGREHTIIYDRVLAGMYSEGFHPGTAGAAPSPGSGGTTLPVPPDPIDDRPAPELPKLDAAGWNSLRDVASLKSDPVRFGRGGSRLTMEGEEAIEDVARTLSSWPTYYCTVVGQALDRGDAAANRRLAQARADAVRERLVAAGVSADRLRTQVVIGSGSSAAVDFRFGELPY